MRRAVAYLRKADPVMAGVIDQVGPCRLQLHRDSSYFETLARTIIYQQLSGKAAATIHGRLAALFPDQTPTPEALAALPDDAIRSTGVSRQKLGYLRDLSLRVATGDVPIDGLDALSDEDAVAALTRVKGIGTWSAQIFLMFRLGRPDVLPVLDLGLRKGAQRAYRMRKLPTPERLQRLGESWRPYRTVASWYLWRFIDGEADI